MFNLRSMSIAMASAALLASCASETSQLDQLGIRDAQRAKQQEAQKKDDERSEIVKLLEQYHFTLDSSTTLVKPKMELRQQILDFFGSDVGEQVIRISFHMKTILNQPPVAIPSFTGYFRFDLGSTVFAEYLDELMFEQRQSLYLENYFRSSQIVPIANNFLKKDYSEFGAHHRVEHFESWVGQNHGFERDKLKAFLVEESDSVISRLIDAYRLLPDGLQKDMARRFNRGEFRSVMYWAWGDWYPAYRGEEILNRHVGMANRLAKYPTITIRSETAVAMSRDDFDFITNGTTLQRLADFLADDERSDDIDEIVIGEIDYKLGKSFDLDKVDDTTNSLTIHAKKGQTLEQNIEYVLDGRLTLEDVYLDSDLEKELQAE